PWPPRLRRGRAPPPLAEREVVLVRASLVAVPLDEQQLARVVVEPAGIRLENLGVALADVGLVEIEVDGLQVVVQLELGRRRRWTRRLDGGRSGGDHGRRGRWRRFGRSGGSR